MPRATLLDHAILGLLLDEPRSGYALRKLFATTPIGRFSSSPGAIYPALRRMERTGFIRGAEDRTHRRRPATVFRLTPAGRRELVAWLSAPVTRADAAHAEEELILRFAFFDRVPEVDSLRFLAEVRAGMTAEARDLKAWLANAGRELPPHARLAPECGAALYETRARWAERAAAELCRRTK